MYEGRLLRKIAGRAIECGKGIWVKNMVKCVDDFEEGIGEEEGEEHVDKGVGGETKAGDDEGNCGP